MADNMHMNRPVATILSILVLTVAACGAPTDVARGVSPAQSRPSVPPPTPKTYSAHLTMPGVAPYSGTATANMDSLLAALDIVGTDKTLDCPSGVQVQGAPDTFPEVHSGAAVDVYIDGAVTSSATLSGGVFRSGVGCTYDFDFTALGSSHVLFLLPDGTSVAPGASIARNAPSVTVD